MGLDESNQVWWEVCRRDRSRRNASASSLISASGRTSWHDHTHAWRCGASVEMLNRLVNRNVHSGDVFGGVVGEVDNTLHFSLASQMKYNPDSVRPFIPAPWLV
jgi:hypothetical protein